MTSAGVPVATGTGSVQVGPERAPWLPVLRRYLRDERAAMALLTLLVLATTLLHLANPLLLSRYVDDAATGSTLKVLVWLGVAFIVASLIGQVTTVVGGYIGQQVGWRATNRMRLDLTRHCMSLDAGFHEQHGASKLVERIDGDVSTLSTFLSVFVISVAGRGLLATGIVVLSFVLDWRLGLVFLVFAALMIGITQPLKGRAIPPNRAFRQASAQLSGELEEMLNGREDALGNGARDYLLRKIDDALAAYVRWKRSSAVAARYFSSALEGLVALATVGVLALGAILLRADAVSLGTVFAGYFYALLLGQTLTGLTLHLDAVQGATACLERINELLSTPTRVTDGTRRLPAGPLSIELVDVGFGYADGPEVLHDLSLTVPPGTRLGLVGRTASGKSSIARLISRQRDVRSGRILIGGIDIRSVARKDLTARIAVVTQDVQIFDASVRDNITLFDDRVPTVEVADALIGLGLGDWLAELPDGLETRIVAGQDSMSGGEAQILAFARAFLRRPDIVIMDEASSRLDPATERMVDDVVHRLLAGRTAIVIAHHLGTLDTVDDIAVMEAGRIVEYGPRELLAESLGPYFGALTARGLA